MNRARTLSAIAIIAMLAGCQAQPSQPRTEHYFETHDADRVSVIEQCRTSDRQYEPEEECAAALRAQRVIAMRKDAGGS